MTLGHSKQREKSLVGKTGKSKRLSERKVVSSVNSSTKSHKRVVKGHDRIKQKLKVSDTSRKVVPCKQPLYLENAPQVDFIANQSCKYQCKTPLEVCHPGLPRLSGVSHVVIDTVS